jgi:hypothetical protein
MGDTTISVSVSPSSVSVPLTAGGTGQANNPISITSTLTDPLNTSVNIYGYFVSATAALTGSALGVTIPTSAVFGIVPTGLPSSYTSFTQTSPFGGSGASLQLVALTGLTTNHSQTDNLTLRINLSGIPLPADTYIGTLYIQSQAF